MWVLVFRLDPAAPFPVYLFSRGRYNIKSLVPTFYFSYLFEVHIKTLNKSFDMCDFLVLLFLCLTNTNPRIKYDYEYQK